MARRTQGTGFESATSRKAFRPQRNPHRHRLLPGLGLGYYKPEGEGVAGSWVALSYDAKSIPKECRKTLGVADDFSPADGVTVLSWEQAQEMARDWRKSLRAESAKRAMGEVVHAGPFTVNAAWENYIADAKARGVKGLKIMSQCYDAHIKPVLGHVEVASLSKIGIQKWLVDLSETSRRSGKKRSPDEGISARKRTKANKETELKAAPKPKKASRDPKDTARARKDSANRVFTNLKSALNLAAREGKTGGNTSWRDVKPFGGTTSNRIRVLTIEEQRKLVAACSAELRPLAIVALHTGGRYGELARVRVKDLQEKTLHIEFGKGKGAAVPRDVMLSPEAQSWLKAFVEGRPREELMFLRRPNIERTKRKELLQDWDGWAEYDQIYAMEQAVQRARIDPVTFHELRHTYASGLLNKGVSLKYVAEQLGHKDTRMVERHYGHIAKAAMREAIEKHSPVLGLEG